MAASGTLGMLLVVVLGASAPAGAQPLDASVEKGMAYLDGRAGTWIRTPFSFVHSDDHTCTLSCHTTLPYVMARAEIPTAFSPTQETATLSNIRSRLADRIGRWQDVAPYYDFNKEQSRVTEAMGNAIAELLLARGGQRGSMLDRALDNLFALQLATGDWNWMDESLAPFENRKAHFWGAALMAYAFGETDDARVGKLHAYLRANFAAANLHGRMMAVRASAKAQGILAADDVRALRAELAGKQNADGSWTLAALGPFSLKDALADSVGDGYATGAAVLTLLDSGTAPTDAGVRRAKVWLLSHQDTSGAWLMKSLNDPGAAFNNLIISDAATAYASMALARLSVSH